jgi:hypothetical protein
MVFAGNQGMAVNVGLDREEADKMFRLVHDASRSLFAGDSTKDAIAILPQSQLPRRSRFRFRAASLEPRVY